MAVFDTYVAELDRGDGDVPPEARLVGVAASSSRRLHALVDEARPALGPPRALRDDHADAAAAFRIDGLCASGAHNAAWDRVDFADRYREHLASDPDARSALDSLCATLNAGADVVIVGPERSGELRSHRTVLREVLAERTDDMRPDAGDDRVDDVSDSSDAVDDRGDAVGAHDDDSG
ncbi:hypothetical protein [Halobaculum rubrum]|uniref:DUF488 family protein, N3 subclade n=1 Tax=Halobaculum rubrum TaxID=2872158 RepID=UPI001CA3AB1D|nr:hypothetical protein [Halobaculum rubrum]QZX98623.1 hypothetical protein K6T25_10070 [Halobaculum rubrum]